MRKAGDRGQTTGVTDRYSSRKNFHVPKLERNLISERQASLMFGLLFVKNPTVAHLGTGEDVCFYFSYSPSSGLYEMTARRRKTTPERALGAKCPPQRDIMELHHLLAHPSKHITKATAKATGLIITVEWRPCVACDRSKAHRHAVPRTQTTAPLSGRTCCTLTSLTRWNRRVPVEAGTL